MMSEAANKLIENKRTADKFAQMQSQEIMALRREVAMLRERLGENEREVEISKGRFLLK